MTGSPQGGGAEISVWAGPVLGNRLVSEAVLTGPFRATVYDDCAVFNPPGPAPSLRSGEIGGLSTCYAGLYLGIVVGEAKRSDFAHRRGVAFVKAAHRRGNLVRSVTVFTGDTMLAIRGRGNASFADLEADRRASTGHRFRVGRAFAAALPAEGNAEHGQVCGRDGRPDRSQANLDQAGGRPEGHRTLVRFSSRLNLLGPIKTKTCTKEETDPFAGY